MGIWIGWRRKGVRLGVLLGAISAASCTYEAWTLTRPSYLDGDWDQIGGDPSGLEGDVSQTACPEGYTGLRCKDCASSYIAYEDPGSGDLSCIPLCTDNQTDCGEHGTCGVLDGGEVCSCDRGWRGTTCNECDGGWIFFNDNCIPGCDEFPITCVHGECADDPPPVHCRCELGYAGLACEGCAAGYQWVFNGVEDVCSQTCQGLGWLGCGSEAVCAFDPVGIADCRCINGYREYDTNDDVHLCEPSCSTLDSDCWSFTDGESGGSCTELFEAPECQCRPGYVYLADKGTCEPDCLNFCSPVTTASCTPSSPFGGAVCTCPAAHQDNDGDGECSMGCTTSDCDGLFLGCRDDSGTRACVPVVYVDRAAPEGGTGASWSDAANNFGAALDAAMNITATGDPLEIWVAEGQYDLTATILLTNDMHIYGGFPGGGSTFDQRDWQDHSTVLDGDGDLTHIVETVASASNIRLDGLIIQGGAASDNSTDDSRRGGGLLAKQAYGLRITDCLFASNTALEGGAIYLEAGSDVVLQHVTFFGNGSSTGTQTGGAVHLEAGSQIALVDIRVIGNQTSSPGAGLYARSVNGLEIRDSLFTSNTATMGSGVYLEECGTSVQRVVFASNFGNGGALAGVKGTTAVTNSLFLSNGNPTGGAGSAGAMSFSGTVTASQDLTVLSSTFIDNHSGGGTESIKAVTIPVVAFNDIFWHTNSTSAQLRVLGETTIAVGYSLLCGGIESCPDCQDNGGLQDEAPSFRERDGSATEITQGAQSYLRKITIAENELNLPPFGEIKGSFIVFPDSTPHRFFQIAGSTDREVVFIDPGNVTYAPGAYKIVDFHLAPGSAGLDAGHGDVPGVPSRDKGQRQRIDIVGLPNRGIGNPPYIDIGCYESDLSGL